MRPPLVLLLLLPWCGLAARTAPADEPIDYVKQIKPILSARCYSCHGALQQRNKLRTDTVKSLVAGGDGGPAIEPGKADESLLIDLITAEGEGRMPPPSDGEALKPEQIALIKAWIDQGAVAPDDDHPEPDPRDHWAFRAPVQPPIPSVDGAAPGNPIDAFLAAGWKDKGLKPQPEAPKGLLQRRVYLDLIGMPPTAEEQAAFLADDRPEAYETMVDRLLASKQYAERWGRHWMDIWRYSDWWGLGAELRNSQKHIWHWRDWIIESLAADKGYDRMVREMLAADEIAPDDLDSLRATGFLARNYFKFNRNTWLEEVVEHTGKAFLGLTFNCAKCHDHKYDPIGHKDYYRFRAFFEPYQVRTDQVPGQLDFEKDGIPRAYDAHLDAPTYRFERGNEANPIKDQPLKPGIPALLAWADLDIKPVALPAAAALPSLRPFVLEDHLKAAEARIATARAAVEKAKAQLAAAEAGAAPTVAEGTADVAGHRGFRDDFATPRPDDWETVSGSFEYKDGKLRQGNPAEIRSAMRTKAPHPADFRASLRFTITGGEPWRSVGLAFDSGEGREILVYLSAHAGGPKLQISPLQGGNASYPAEGAVARSVKIGEPYELTVSARGNLLNVAINGEHALAYRLSGERAPGSLALITYAATAEFTSMEVAPLPAGQVLIESGVPVYKGSTPVEQAKAGLTLAEKALAIALAHPEALKARAAADRARHQQPPADDAKALAIAATRAERQENLAKAEEALAGLELRADPKSSAEEAAKKREAATAAVDAAKKALEAESEEYTPLRGAVKATESPTDTEAPNVVAFPDTSTGRRSALANWLTDRKNPLTARVAVNHIWSRHFGKPLVPTVFDFGRKGTKPTHPELLDWLAVDFMENGWSMKRLHRMIVLSDAYRRSSSTTGADPATLAADPENHLYWRMNPVRMEAQVVRDSLFHLAGELSDASGGPPVPLSEEMSPRRGIYFVHSHNDHDKFLSTFDDASVQDCYRRGESVVPVQALALWNSKLALTMGAKIAARLGARLGDVSDAKFAEEAFRTILAAPPTPDELAACEQALGELKALLEKRGAPDPARRAREILVQSLLNHNDFITIR